MADNSGHDSDLRNVLSLDVVYNPESIDTTKNNKTDTYLPPLFHRSFSLSPRPGISSSFAEMSLSFLTRVLLRLLIGFTQRRVYTSFRS